MPTTSAGSGVNDARSFLPSEPTPWVAGRSLVKRSIASSFAERSGHLPQARTRRFPRARHKGPVRARYGVRIAWPPWSGAQSTAANPSPPPARESSANPETGPDAGLATTTSIRATQLPPHESVLERLRSLRSFPLVRTAVEETLGAIRTGRVRGSSRRTTCTWDRHLFAAAHGPSGDRRESHCGARTAREIFVGSEPCVRNLAIGQRTSSALQRRLASPPLRVRKRSGATASPRRRRALEKRRAIT